MAVQTRIVDVTLSPTTAALSASEVIADTQELFGFFREADRPGTIRSLCLIDSDDNKAAIDIYFLSANVSLGSENDTLAITDANAAEVLGFIAVSTGDYKDLGGASVAFKQTIMPVRPNSGGVHLYVGAVNGAGTPTYTATGLKLRIGVELD